MDLIPINIHFGNMFIFHSHSPQESILLTKENLLSTLREYRTSRSSTVHVSKLQWSLQWNNKWMGNNYSGWSTWTIIAFSHTLNIVCKSSQVLISNLFFMSYFLKTYVFETNLNTSKNKVYFQKGSPLQKRNNFSTVHVGPFLMHFITCGIPFHDEKSLL